MRRKNESLCLVYYTFPLTPSLLTFARSQKIGNVMTISRIQVCMRPHILPLTLAAILVALALLPPVELVQFYHWLFALFPVSKGWVAKHSVTISDTGHVLGFALLALVGRWGIRRPLWIIVLFCIILAAGIELVQTLTPQRQGRWDDLAFGVIGLALGLFIYQLAHFRYCRGRTKPTC